MTGASQSEPALAALADLAGRAGILGAALLTREGQVVHQSFRSSCNVEAVCAMAAAMIGAADAALRDVSGDPALAFSARAADHAMAGEALDDDHLVLVVARDEAAARDAARAAAATLSGMLQKA